MQVFWTLFGALGLAAGIGFIGCAHVSRPCQDGFLPGQEPRELSKEEKVDAKPAKRWPGNKQCDQKKDPESKQWLNHGMYREWYADGHRALEGEYQMGARHGKWLEYDPQGKVISERWFESGNEVTKRVPAPAASPIAK